VYQHHEGNSTDIWCTADWYIVFHLSVIPAMFQPESSGVDLYMPENQNQLKKEIAT